MSKTIIGVDVGGTKTQITLYEAFSWKVLDERRFETRAKDGLKEVLLDVERAIDEMRDESTLAVGIGIPGYVQAGSGIVVATPNIKLEEPLEVGAVMENLDLPIFVDNDANLFTYAEYKMNWEREGVKNIVGLTLGTGFGGGLILNGKIFYGNDGFAAEVGHMVFNEKEEFEDLVSAKGKDKDRGKYLGMAIANLVNLLNPAVIVLGGGLAPELEESHFEAMWKEIERKCIKEAFDDLAIYVTSIKNSGALGAAIMAMEKVSLIDKDA